MSRPCGRRRRIVVRLAFVSAVVLAVVVALTVVEVGVTLRWSSWSSSALPSFEYHIENGNGRDNNGGERDEPPGAHGKRAYAVAFPDVKDPLVLERALALWNSLMAWKQDGEDIVAIVPRYLGQQLVSPLEHAGYRVLQRDTLAPPWRASGRFVQQALAAIGAGWGSVDPGGGGGSDGHGWSLLALEALSLTEYEEVVVLDQKMVIFRPEEHQRTARKGSSGSSRNGHEAEGPRGQASGQEKGNEGEGKDRWRFLGGDGNSGGRTGEDVEAQEGSENVSATADRLPPLVPQGGEWVIAFAAGDISALVPGPGLESLSEAQRDRISGQHAAFITVRPSAERYEEMSNFLCMGDKIFSEAYPGLPDRVVKQRLMREEIFGRRAPTIPLLHLAVEFALSRETTAKVPLEICVGGSEFVEEERGSEWRWTGAALPVVWCPSAPSRPQQQQRWRRRQTRRLDQRDAERTNDSGASSVLRVAGSFAAPSLPRVERGTGGSDFGDEGLMSDFELEVKGEKWQVHRVGRKKSGDDSFAAAAAASVAATDAKVGGEGCREGRRRRGVGRSSGSPQTTALLRESGVQEALDTRRRRLDESGGGGGVDEGWGKERRGQGAGQESRGGEAETAGGHPKERIEEGGEEEEEGEVDIEMEDSERGGVGAVRLAWIPGDPCSCVEAPGMVGEACRGWLMMRAGEVPAPAKPTRTERDEGAALASALSVCKDGVFASPLSLPAVPAEEAPLAAATAGASRLPRHSADGVMEGVSPPPPLWQKVKPTERAVVTQRDLQDFQHFWLANVDKKLLMVAIPKVACTQVHALFLRVQGSANWNSQHMQDIHFHRDMIKYKMSAMPNMTPERASSILNDPTWTKGVLLRDPAERLLSCFLDKIVQRKSYSVSIFRANQVLSFEKFVALTSKDARARFQEQYPGGNLGLSRRSNPHWRPQLYFGLDKFLPYFDFVGDFKHVAEHSEALLRRAGLWEEFGASGWGRYGDAAFFQRSTVEGHATGSRDSITQYYTPALLASVREAYGPTDYRMLADLGWWNGTAINPS